MFKFFMIAFSVEIRLFNDVAAFDPEIALNNYTAKCREILHMSDPFDRLDRLRGNFTDGFITSTDEIAKMLMYGPLGELTNGTGLSEGTEIHLLASGLPYLKKLAPTFNLLSERTSYFNAFNGLDTLWTRDSCTDAMIIDLNSLVDDVGQRVHDDFGGMPDKDVQGVVGYFENNTNANYAGWWRSESCVHAIDNVVDPMLERMNQLFGKNCSGTASRDLNLFYLIQSLCGTTNPCLHKFLLRYSNYSERAYSKFVDTAGKYLFVAMNLYGLCLPIAEDAMAAEKKAKFTAAVKSISEQLKLAFWDDTGTNARREKCPISSSTVASEYWPATAMLAARNAFGSETATWPSPEAPTAFYETIGGKVQERLNENFAFRNWFKYEVAVYWPAEESTEHCVLNLTNDVFYELRYKNTGYFVSRSGRDRKDIDLEELWQHLNDSGAFTTLKTRFM